MRDRVCAIFLSLWVLSPSHSVLKIEFSQNTQVYVGLVCVKSFRLPQQESDRMNNTAQSAVEDAALSPIPPHPHS